MYIREFLFQAVMNLPAGLFLGGVCLLFSKGLLMFKHPVIAAIVKLALGLASFAAIAGLLYGLLRYGGAITFATDNTMSWNWFDASWRDDGFPFIYYCSFALIGIVLAILSEWKAHRAEAQSFSGAQ